jgi:hypothetical protein
MAPEDQLQLGSTFEEQRILVNSKIVPNVMKSLDLNTFPIAETVVYEIVHNRHKHRREEYLTRNRSEKHQNEQLKRKHLNSRRNDVSN